MKFISWTWSSDKNFWADDSTDFLLFSFSRNKSRINTTINIAKLKKRIRMAEKFVFYILSKLRILLLLPCQFQIFDKNSFPSLIFPLIFHAISIQNIHVVYLSQQNLRITSDNSVLKKKYPHFQRPFSFKRSIL